MSDTKLLEILAARHQDWVSMVISMGCANWMAEDIVQDMYLKMHRLSINPSRITYQEKGVNTFYVYTTLKNLYLDYLKERNRHPQTDLLEVIEESRSEVESKETYEEFLTAIDEEIKTWQEYDQLLMRVYLSTDMSLRDISNGTKISLGSIFNTITNGKTRIQTNCKDSYEAWKKAQEES